jgi:hypothetical protein
VRRSGRISADPRGVWAELIRVCRLVVAISSVFFLSRFGWIAIGALHDPCVSGLESRPVHVIALL